MKLNPKFLEGFHEVSDSGFSVPAGLSEAEVREWTESLQVYTLFDSVPELVDYVFALDVF